MLRTLSNSSQTLVASGVETVADLAALELRDLGQYGLDRDAASKLGRAVRVWCVWFGVAHV